MAIPVSNAVRQRALEMEKENPDLRIGQATFNALCEIEPELAELVRSQPQDPFFRDEQLPDFWAWLASWEE